MAKTDFQSIEEYITASPAGVQPKLEAVRALFREGFPGAEEGISYQIPCFKLRGSYALYFAGYKGHYSIYPATRAIVAELAGELGEHLDGKATIRFDVNRPVPVELIRRIVACRANEIAAGPAKPKKRTPKLA